GNDPGRPRSRSRPAGLRTYGMRSPGPFERPDEGGRPGRSIPRPPFAGSLRGRRLESCVVDWLPARCRMGYAVKEIFYTLQGEGAHTGRAAVFCRFAGCNLRTGLEAAAAAGA